MPRLPATATSQEQEVGDVRERETSGARARNPLSSAEHTIAIVGTGFCLTVLARELLRRAADRPLRVLLVGREAPGRGIAYARHRHPYTLAHAARRARRRSGSNASART
jgi:hypothetical protein